MLLDKIRMRKIRYDVLEYCERLDFVEKVESFISSFKENNNNVNIDNGQDLLKEANLDYYETDLGVIIEKLEQYLLDFNDYQSLDHSKLLDYLIEYLFELTKEENSSERLEKLYKELNNFIFQLVQIQAFENKLLMSVSDIYYIGEDKSIYDRETNKKTIDIKKILKKYNLSSVSETEDINDYIQKFLIEMIIKDERKIITSLDYDDDGYFVAIDGDHIFDDKEKEEMLEDTKLRVEFLINLFLNNDNEQNIDNQQKSN